MSRHSVPLCCITLYYTVSYESALVSLKAFLEEFKSLFAQLLNQNSMILSMLSTLISPIKHHTILKIAQWNANGIQQHKEEVKIFLQ
jgi:hypothetical protein